MGKSLIITEKPSVAREFARVLGVSGRGDGYIENDAYVITWCVGHLVGLVYPESYDIRYKKWKLEDLPFLPETYKYDVIESVRRQYDVVHAMLMREDIERVYWAGDAGKEGQTIEENIRNFGGVRPGMEELRVWIDSQTEEEILRGIREARPMSDYANLGYSGIMRTIEDYAMGINFSRVMSVKYAGLLNDAAGTRSYTAIAVGRVMTCVLGMVVKREREIREFAETPFYRVLGRFTDAGVEGEWKAAEGSKYFESPLLYKENGFKEKEHAQALIESLAGGAAYVESVEKGTSRKRAPLLFNLAELQAECAKRFKISPDQTLEAAQTLYERKLTTYPRTDARVLSTAVAKEIAGNISRLAGYGPAAAFVKNIVDNRLYAGIAKTQYTDDSKITDHYAIIPTGQLTELKALNTLQRAVFDLIVRRFLSIFYPPAEYMTVKLAVSVEAGEHRELFFATAKALKKPGYLEIAGIPGKKEKGSDHAQREAAGEEDRGSGEDSEEPANAEALFALAETLRAKDAVTVGGYTVREGKTSPPKRYTSGSMVLAMENAGQLIEDEELREQIRGSGIGTSATRAEIIQKLVRIGYLNLNKKTQVLTPERLGEMVYEVVNMTVPALLNPKMTASWEKGLEGITQGTVDFWDYRRKLEDFIRTETLKMRDQNLREALAEKISSYAGKDAKGVKRKIGAACPVCGGEMVTTPFGYGCSNYKTDKSGCNFSIGEIAGVALSEEQAKGLLKEGHTGTIRGFKSRAGKKFDACLKLEREEESGKVSVSFDFSEVEPELVPDVSCPVCGGKIKKTPFGYGCVNYTADDEASCRFSVGKIAGKLPPISSVKKLLGEGHTDLIRGFKAKNGSKFDACLKMERAEDGKVRIVFDFPDRQAPEETKLACPRCGKLLMKSRWRYECSCGFSVSHTVARVELSEEIMAELFATGRTAQRVTGFTSKAGNLFDSCLKYEDEKIVFDFERKPEPVLENK